MKVIKTFFCLQELKTYNPGDTYTGKRKDLTSYMDPATLPKKKSAAPKTKNKNAAPTTKNKNK